MNIAGKIAGIVTYILLLLTVIYVDLTANVDLFGHLVFALAIAFIVVCGLGVYKGGDASSDPE
jgi:hypothetical protein